MQADRSLFTWLHLSDIHFGQGTEATHWDQRLVLSQLLNDVRAQVEKHRIALDAVFITGDVAYSGNAKAPTPGANPVEYQDAAQWLEDVLTAVNVPHDRVFVVPGNHDGRRDTVPQDGGLRRLLSSLRKGEDTLDDALKAPADRTLLLSRFGDYHQFACQYSPSLAEAGADISWEHQLGSNGLRIRLVGLNTALLALDKFDKTLLRVGKQQYGRHLEHVDRQQDLIVVMTHHPCDWLADGDELQGWLVARAHLHLCGHIHSQDSEKLRSGGGRKLIRVVAGAAHSEDAVVGHGYNIGAIVQTEAGDLVVRVRPRLWSSPNKDFRTDMNCVPDGAQFADHVVEGLTLRAARPGRLAGPELAPAPAATAAIGGTVPAHAAPAPVVIPARAAQHACDAPPISPAWVGREVELQLLRDPAARVVSINGIGGQGKSVLAARHQHSSMQDGFFEFWDWRDCREEGDTLQMHLLRIVEWLSGGRVTVKDVAADSHISLVQLLFQFLGERRGLFVFDNIDKYVDADSGTVMGGMATLLEAALRRPHRSQFIFTCRPALHYSDQAAFLNVPMGGLSVAETQRLFELRGVRVDDRVRRSIAEATALTFGHPLWLNLLATQVARNRAELSDLIEDIKRGKGGAVLPTATLNSIWRTLTEKQKAALRLMAAMPRGDTEERIADYVESEMNYNQLNKALRFLRSVDLIVTKRTPGGPEILELHPVIKSYILSSWTRNERARFATVIIRFFDNAIARIMRKLDHDTPFNLLENWTLKAELAINAGNLAEAFGAINQVLTPLLRTGYGEEFVRLCTQAFRELDWRNSIVTDEDAFERVFDIFVKKLADFGRFAEAEDWLVRFSEISRNRSSRFILLCELRSYCAWLAGEHQRAIEWASQGVDLKTSSHIDTRHDCGNNLALAQRDAGLHDEALARFSEGESVEAILISEQLFKDKDGTYFGNIGRCLQFKGDYNGALVCYRRSFQHLNADTASNSYMNQGYVHFWIGEVLEKKGEKELAAAFYRKAEFLWRNIAPPKADEAREHFERVASEPDSWTETRASHDCKCWFAK